TLMGPSGTRLASPRLSGQSRKGQGVSNLEQLVLGLEMAPRFEMRPSPELVACMQMLSLGGAELEERAAEELEENPALERDDTPGCASCRSPGCAGGCVPV